MRTSSPGAIALAATAVTVLAIWLSGAFVPAHTGFDPPRWIPLPSDADSWRRVGAPDAATFGPGVTLESSAFGTNHLYLDLPLARPTAGERTWLLLGGRLLEEPREGRSWASGELGVSFRTASGRRLGYTPLRFVPRRATARERFADVLDWPVEAASVELSLHSRAGAPTFSLREGSAEFVRPNPLYRVALAGLAVMTLLWAWTMIRFARSRGAVRALLVPGALAVAILAGVTLSLGRLRSMLMPLLVTLENEHGVDRDLAVVLLLKGGHAFGFFLLTLGLLRLRRHLDVGRTPMIAFAVLLAVGSEGLQSHLSNRGASLGDVLIDLGGVFVALALARLFGGRRRGRTRRRRSDRRRSSIDGNPSGDVVTSASIGDDAVDHASDARPDESPEGGRRRRRRRRSSRPA